MTGKGAGVYLWWIGAGPPPAAALEEVRTHVERVFGLATRVWHGCAAPPDAYDATRNQYSSTRILAWLIQVGSPDAHKLLAITDQDLFMPVLTFVFGEAPLGGRVALVSTARLLPPGGSPARGGRLFAARLVKEAVHELGHGFGLVHCDQDRCVMSRSSSLLQVDAKSGGLCQDCWTRYLDLRQHPGGSHE